MSQFVKVGERLVNLEYVSRVEVDADGNVKLYVDDQPPMNVPTGDVEELMDALRPKRLAPAQLLVAGGMGGAGLPAGMFRNAPEPTLPIVPPTPPTPPIAPTPAAPVATSVPTPLVPGVPEVSPEPTVPEVLPGPDAESTGKTKSTKTAAK